jgi:hypothetical protein
MAVGTLVVVVVMVVVVVVWAPCLPPHRSLLPASAATRLLPGCLLRGAAAGFAPTGIGAGWWVACMQHLQAPCCHKEHGVAGVPLVEHHITWGVEGWGGGGRAGGG